LKSKEEFEEFFGLISPEQIDNRLK